MQVPVDRFEVEGFRFNRIFKRLDVIDSRIKDERVYYRVVQSGRFRWIERYELVWTFYKKQKRLFGWHLHHKNMNKLDDRPSNLVQITRKEHAAIHGKVYDEEGHGGSSRNTGTAHTNRTRLQMTKSMMGNKNLPKFRDSKWKERISKGQSRVQKRGKKLPCSMRQLINEYVNSNINIGRITLGRKYNVNETTIKNRIKWFLQDNKNKLTNINMPCELKEKYKGKDLSKFRYYDEEFNLRNTLEFLVVNERVYKGKMFHDIINNHKLKETEDDLIQIVDKFKKVNGLDEKVLLKDMRKLIRKIGIDVMVNKMFLKI